MNSHIFLLTLLALWTLYSESSAFREWSAATETPNRGVVWRHPTPKGSPIGAYSDLLGEGEGDCDDDGECQVGLMCGLDNCKTDFGHLTTVWDISDDCCYVPEIDPSNIYPNKISPTCSDASSIAFSTDTAYCSSDTDCPYQKMLRS